MNAEQRAILVSVICLGISTIITQIIALREFLNVFAGNELAIGLILGNWLLLTGLGSLLGRQTERLRRPVLWLIISQITIALLPLAMIAAIRVLKSIHAPGLILGIHEIFLYSLILLLPYCLISGFLLALFSGLGGRVRDAGQIGNVYTLDVMGGIIGGMGFSFCLVYYFSSFQALTFLLILNLLAAILVCRQSYSRTGVVSVIIILAGSLTALAVVDWERITARALFAGQNLIYQRATPYGTLAVTETNSQITIFENGVPFGSFPDPIAAEEPVHYAMNFHPDPENVLLISGGLSGVISEAARYPVKVIDYVELDPAVVALVQKFSPPDEQLVNLIAQDARPYVRAQKDRYDVIINNLADPATVQLNRFYSLEFFREVRRALHGDGIFCFSLSGAENYVSEELRALASPVYQALSEVFPNILLIPGNRLYFVASTRPLDYEISSRLAAKGITTRYVNDDYLRARLTQDRLAMAREMTAGPALLNQDFRPAGYLGLFRLWLAHFQTSLLLPILIAVGILAAFIFLLAGASRRPVAIAMSASGFAGMGLEIVLLIAFQVCYGQVYQQMGMLIAAFLAGTGAGALWATQRRHNHLALLTRLDILLGLLAVVLAPILMLIQKADPLIMPDMAIQLAFPALMMATGFLVGGQFPLAARLAFNGVEKTAGTLYCLDYLGAALGALLVSALIIPWFGIITTCYLLGGLKFMSAAGLLVWRRSPGDAPALEPEKNLANQTTWGAALLVFVAIALLIIMDDTATPIYTLSFQTPYHWLLLALLAYGIWQAMQATAIDTVTRQDRSWTTGLAEKILYRTRLSLFRWCSYFIFSLAVFYPIFRCYFKIPYLFCHVCPRQCVFGFLRPYLVPAALIMNMEKRRWCFNACPIGTLFDCQARVAGRAVQLPIIFKILPYAILILSAIAYFKVKSDQTGASLTGSDWYMALYRNVFAPDTIVILVAVGLLLAAFLVRRPFCEYLCPVGTCSRLILAIGQFFSDKQPVEYPVDREPKPVESI